MKDDNIELRSEKVRNIIGQIPPGIIRFGIMLVFLVIILMLSISFFLKYEYTVKAIASIEQKKDTTFICLKIPTNELIKVNKRQKVILYFNNIPNLSNTKIITEIQNIPNTIEIFASGAYCLSCIKLTGILYSDSGKVIVINTKKEITAEIFTDSESFFERITEPIKSMFNRKK